MSLNDDESSKSFAKRRTLEASMNPQAPAVHFPTSASACRLKASLPLRYPTLSPVQSSQWESPLFSLRMLTYYMYKDPGGPAQLGIRDWAGLKGHGADRDLARYAGQKRAAPGEANSHVHRHRDRAPKSRTWVGYNSV